MTDTHDIYCSAIRRRSKAELAIHYVSRPHRCSHCGAHYLRTGMDLVRTCGVKEASEILRLILNFGASMYDYDDHGVVIHHLQDHWGVMLSDPDNVWYPEDYEFPEQELEALCLAGMSPNLTVGSNGLNLLMSYAYASAPAVETLLRHRADVTATTVNGWTALMYACAYDMSVCSLADTYRIIEMLLDADSPLRAETHQGRTAADIFEAQKSTNGSQELLDRLSVKRRRR